jgi:hypothetical protein
VEEEEVLLAAVPNEEEDDGIEEVQGRDCHYSHLANQYKN